MAELIGVKNLSCGYQGKPVINNASLGVEEGEFLGIIGPNGSGKSTLLRALTRCLKPYNGGVYYKGKSIYDIQHSELAREFAFVPQDMVFNFAFNAWEIVLMGRIPYLRRLEQEGNQDLEVARNSMLVTGTLTLADRQINELSAGERQMIVIAKALAQQPRVLFLDEPTSHLDIGHQVRTLNLLKKLNREQNITVIMVIHDLNLASEYCDRILLLDKGAVYKIGKPLDVLTYENIEEVYKTLVIVNKNPITSNPHVLLVKKEKP